MCVKLVNLIIVVIMKVVWLDDFLLVVFLIIKKIFGNIWKCVGCSKFLLLWVEGFWGDYDFEYCCGRYEVYYYWNKGLNCY